MNYLIASATRKEIEPLIRHYDLKERADGSFKIDHGNDRIDIVITGVGLMQTAYNLGRIVYGKQFNLAVNIGIAGSFKPSWQLGEVVNVSQEIIADLGAEDPSGFLDIHELGLLDKEQFPFSDGMLMNRHVPDNEILAALPRVKGISVNKVHGMPSSIDEVVAKYDPDVESMEGAAFLFACLSDQIDCIQLRSISNWVTERNKDSWQTEQAIENVNLIVIDMIDAMVEVGQKE